MNSSCGAQVSSHMSHSLNSLKGGYIGVIQGTTIGVIKGDTRSLDYSSYGGFLRYEGFLKLGVPILGVSIIRTVEFWGVYWGPPI